MQYKCMKGQKIHQRTGWVMVSSTVSLLFLHGGHDYEETGTHFYHHIFQEQHQLNIPQQVYRLSEKAVPPFRGKCTAYPPRCTAYSLGYDVKII